MSQDLTIDPALARLADAILIPPFRGLAAPDWLLAALERGLAGVTLFGGNVTGTGQVAELSARLRSVAQEPLIAIDEEGGDVTRLAHLTGSPYPGNAALGAVDDPALTRRVYHAIGADLAAAGINVDLAPSVDVNTENDNPVIGTRAFGAGPGLVSRHAAAAVTGLQLAGIAACAKHFPGHGSTRDDTHEVVATVPGGADALWRRDLPPFQAAIAAGVKAVMTGHLRVPHLTGDLPATMSHAALTCLLRDRLGFGGVIVSDALEMRALRQACEPGGICEAAVRATSAGVDLLCFGRDQDEQTYLAVRAALADAVAAGTLKAERLEDAAARVQNLRGWLTAARKREPCTDESVGLVAARRAARLLRPRCPSPGQEAPDLPAPPGAHSRPFVLQLESRASIAAGPVPWGLGPWLAESEILRVPVTAREGAAGGATVKAALERAAGRRIIVVVRGAHRDASARDVICAVLSARPDLIIVEMGLPVWRPLAATYLATYGAGYVNCQVAAEILGLDTIRDAGVPGLV